MLKAVSMVLTMVMSLVVVSNLVAADGKGGKKEGGRPAKFELNPIDMMVKGLKLTDAQKAKVAELKKEYDPKFKQARASVDSILTDEQKKATKEAKESAKDPKELWKIVKVTDAQMAKLKEGRKAMQTLRQEVRVKVMDILTPEQKTQMLKTMMEHKENGHPKGGHGPGGPGGPDGGNGPEPK